MKLVAGLLVKNEADRYLRSVIQNINGYADQLVVLDDGSTDSTRDVITLTAGIPLSYHYVSNGDFGHEYVLRQQLYQLCLNSGADWMIIVDADELLESQLDIRHGMKQLMSDPKVKAWGFRLYDMWNETHYRADHLWRAHEFYTLFMQKCLPDFKAEWRITGQHCGRLPKNIWNLVTGGTDLVRVKHLGWLKEEDRRRKYERYMKLDPNGEYGNLAQYQSILDVNPRLVKYST